MKTHVDAILARLRTTGRTVHFVDAGDKPPLPYFLVWTSAGEQADERDVSALSVDLDTTVGITAAAGDPTGALLMQAEARAVFEAPLSVPNRVVWFSLTDSRAIQVDRDVVLPSTGAHPAYGVDLYRLQSVPA